MASEERHYPSPTTTSPTSSPPSVAVLKRERASATGSTEKSSPGNSSGSFKLNLKVWVLGAILLLASWSMFTGTVTLKWSTAANLARFSSDLLDPLSYDDLDILEVEEREKVVRHMWDVYTKSKSSSSSSSRLPRFWQEAFQAAYEYLASDVPGVRDLAVSEVAKMSLRSFSFFSHLDDDDMRETYDKMLKAKQGTHVAKRP